MLSARTAIVALAFCLAMTADSGGQSRRTPNANPPTPAPAPAPAQEQRGTDQSPLSIKILPGQENKEKAEKEERERQEKAAVDKKIADETERLANYTFWLGFFTLAIFLGALAQILLFYVQLRLIRSEAKKARINLTIAKQAASAAKLNAEAVIDAERARIFVHIERDTSDSIRRAAQAIDVPGMNTATLTTNVGLFYRFKNYGKTPAIIKEISHQVVYETELAKLREYVPVIPLPIDHILGAGATTPESTLACSLGRQINVVEAAAIQNLETSVWFYGYISYDDTFGWARELRYVFFYNGHTGGRFRLASYNEIQSKKRHQDG
jgi:hypothetical protein